MIKVGLPYCAIKSIIKDHNIKMVLLRITCSLSFHSSILSKSLKIATDLSEFFQNITLPNRNLLSNEGITFWYIACLRLFHL
jgi:hypothetical protein